MIFKLYFFGETVWKLICTPLFNPQSTDLQALVGPNLLTNPLAVLSLDKRLFKNKTHFESADNIAHP